MFTGNNSDTYTEVLFSFMGNYLYATHIFVAMVKVQDMYRKVTSSNTSHLEAHAGFFRLLTKGIFNPHVQ